MNAQDDARMAEYLFLAELNRAGSRTVNGMFQRTPERDMLVSLVGDGLLNGMDTVSWSYKNDPPFRLDVQRLEAQNSHPIAVEALHQQVDTLNRLMGGQEVWLSIGHRGRVHLSELEQALKAGRQRTKFGLLLEARHRDQGVQLALSKASAVSPTTVAFLDMNSLKYINDKVSHEAGDQAIVRFLTPLDALRGPNVEGYLDGGDEVVMTFEGTKLADAAGQLEAALRNLMREPIVAGKKRVVVTAACGLVEITNPNAAPAAVVTAAEEQMKRAKTASRAVRGKLAKSSGIAWPEAKPRVLSP